MAEYVATYIADALIAAGVSATTAYVAAYIIITTAVVATAEDQRRSASHKASDAYNRSQRDRYMMVRGNLEPRRVVLGRRRTSGPMAYVGSYGTDREHLVFTVPLAGHEIDAVETVMFNDEPIVLDGSGNVIGILRTEVFSISAASDTFTIAGDAESGSVTATAWYGSTSVTLGVSVSGRNITVTGAHVGEVGRVDIKYRPSPNPFKPTKYATDALATTVTSGGSPQTVTLAHTPLAGTVHVVETLGDTDSEIAFTLSGANVTFTGTNSGNPIHINYQWASNNISLARVRTYLGRQDQAADAGMIAALPDVWTSAHRAAGIAYLVVEFDYDREAFGSGQPNVSAIVRGAKCYDPRKNKVPNPFADGAVVGAPGTLPTGWSRNVSNGLTSEIIGTGTDAATGWPYITMKVSGTATAAGTMYLNPVPNTVAPAAAAGQTWSGRAMVRRLAGMAWTGWSFARLQLVSYDSGGTATVENNTTIGSTSVEGTQDPITVTDTSLATGTVSAGVRLALGYSSGAVIDSTFMLLLPQLWQGAVGAATDPYAWSENVALQAIAYATHPIGGRLPWDQVDMPWLTTEANVCDTSTTYTVGGKDFVRPLYTGGYVALSSQKPTDVLTDICAGMGGEWAYVDGALRLKAGAWRAPVLTIDESWLQGDQAVQIQASLDRDQLVNAISGTYFDARQFYRAISFPPIEPAAYIEADKMKLPLEIEYGSVDFEGQAQYLASCALRSARQGQVVVLKCNLKAWQAQRFDNVALNLARFGFVDKAYTVMSDAFTLEGGIGLVLRETDASVFDMDAGFTAVDPAPNTRLPDPWAIDPVTGLAAASGTAHLLKQADGTIVSRISVTWNAIADPRVRDSTGAVEIRWKATDATDWQSMRVPGTDVQTYISPVQDGKYIQIIARALGAVGASIDSIQVVHQVVGKTAPPANVTGLTASIVYGAVLLEWAPGTDLDYAETELRRGPSWAAGVPLVGSQPTVVRGNRFAWSWPANAVYIVHAKHRDTTAHESATAASVGITVDDTIKLGSSGIDVDLAGINLIPNSSFERDSDLNGLADRLTASTQGAVGSVTNSLVTGRLTGLAQRKDATSMGATAGDLAWNVEEVSVGAGAIQAAAFSIWFKASTNVTFKLQADVRDASNTLLGSVGAIATSDGLTWKRVELLYPNFPATGVKVLIYHLIRQCTDGAAVWMVVDDSQFEEGTVASAWHPYPSESSLKVWIQVADPGAAAKDGDIWFDTDDSNKQWQRVSGAWVSVRDAGISQALVDAANAQSTADGKIVTFYQTTAPTAGAVGDLWFDTDDSKKCYRWSGSAWVLNQDTGIAQALSDAADAQATADGKVFTFFQSTTPTATAVGDLWFKTTDQRMYRWSGSAWVLQSTVGAGDIGTGQIADEAATQVLSASSTSVITNGLLSSVTFTAPVACDVVVTTRSAFECIGTPAADGDPRIRFGPVVKTTGGTTLLDAQATVRYNIQAGINFQAPLYKRAIYPMASGATAVFSASFAGDFTPDPETFQTLGSTDCELEVIKR